MENIVVKVGKIVSQDFHNSLKKIMEKWPEAKDFHAMVKIADAIEKETNLFNKTVKKLTEEFGYEIADGRMSVNPEEITDFLLEKYGSINSESKFSLSGANETEKQDFAQDRGEAQKKLREYDKALNEFLDSEVEFHIPRAIKVLDKYVRKEVISARDCYVLGSLLDLSSVMDPSDSKEAKEEEE